MGWSKEYYAEHKEKILAKNREYYSKNREKMRKWHKEYHQKNKEKIAAQAKERKDGNLNKFRRGRRKMYQRLRQQTINAYGGKCKECAESNVIVLEIDHVNGGGEKHRKELGLTGIGFYYWLRKNGFPQEEFQVLCCNCHAIKTYEELERGVR